MANQASNASLAGVASSATAVTLQAANPSRAGLIVHNNSTAILYVRYGTGAAISSGNYTEQVAANGGTWRMADPIYTGIVTAIWAAANGYANVTELT